MAAHLERHGAEPEAGRGVLLHDVLVTEPVIRATMGDAPDAATLEAHLARVEALVAGRA